MVMARRRPRLRDYGFGGANLADLLDSVQVLTSRVVDTKGAVDILDSQTPSMRKRPPSARDIASFSLVRR
jgi:hypothetical protein